MSKSVVSKRYAKALFDLAKENNKIDAYQQELEVIGQVVLENKGLYMIMNHPKFSDTEKKQLLQNTFGNHVSKDVLNLLKLLVDKKRINELNNVVDCYVELANEERDIAVANVSTVKPLTKEQVTNLKAMLTERLAKKDVKIHNQIDQKIIGGVKIQVGNRILDGTVQTKLARMKRQLGSN